LKQRGYAVLMSLLALLSIAGVWLARVTVQTTAYNATQTLALSNARIALISYAVNYIDHYGAQSAGVGHFPCPDTDAPGSAHADPWHRDGPNPPCAKNAIEHGWLPRHVTVEDGRYHFHSRSHQRLLYAVSGQFVNNPLGRIVNAKTKSEFSVGQYSDVIAVIATPPLDVDIANTDFWSNPEALVSQGGAYSLIRTRDVLVPAMQRVGGWLAGQLNQALAQRCASSDEITEEITDETTDVT